MNSEHTNSPHWTESGLMARLYGLEPEAGHDLDHLRACPQCGARWAALESGRRAVLATALVSSDALEARLRVQRQAVWSRIERPNRRLLWKLVPVTTTALMIFLGLELQQSKLPAPPQQSIAQATDAQFFNEIASMVNQDTPLAADPLQGLFDSSAAPAPVEAQ